MTIQGQNKLLSSIEQYYDGSTWRNSQGSNYEYDSNNNLVSQTSYTWDTSWKINSKEINTYDANKKITVYIYQTLNNTTKNLENSYKILYTYTNGLIAEELYQKWVNSQWVNEGKFDLSYNNNLATSSISYNWDGTQWIVNDRSTITYNSNNKVTEILTEDWVNAQWQNSYKELYTYNMNNKIASEIYYKWNVSNWQEEEKQEYVLDANGNRIKETVYYNGNINYKREYTYDTSSLMSNFIHPFYYDTYYFEDFPYINKLLSMNFSWYDTTTSSFENSYVTTYNYNNSITLGADDFEINNKNFTVFPNPSNNYIQISGLEESENYKIFTITGVEVNKGIISDNEKIDIQNLTNGFYFLKLNKGRTIKILKN